MPISVDRWRKRAELLRQKQPAIDRAKQRYDRRQEMLNDPDAKIRYREQRWEALGQAYQARRSKTDLQPPSLGKKVRDAFLYGDAFTIPEKEVGTPAEALQQTFSPERITEIDEGFDREYAGYVQDQEVKEFLIRRANIAQAAFDQHKTQNPDATDADAYNKMHKTLLQYGFQPRGLHKIVPIRLVKGKVVQDDYSKSWAIARNTVLGVIRGARRMVTSPVEWANAGLEIVTDTYNRNQAGAEVTGSNIFRDARRTFAFENAATEQLLAPQNIPGGVDIPGIVGEQVPNILVAMVGGGMLRGPELASKIGGNALVMGSMFAQEGAGAFNAYMQYGEQQGIDPRLITAQAYAGAMAYGAASAALERAIPTEVFKRIPGFKNRIAAWALGSLAEGTTEFLQSLAESGIGEGIDLGQFNWDSIRTAMREAAAGVIVGGTASAVTMGRAAPQVDQLDSSGLEAVKARAKTELDALKERTTVQEEVDPPIQPDFISDWWIPPEATPETEPASIQTSADAVDRVVTETTGVRSRLRTGWRALLNIPANVINRIPAKNPVGKLRDAAGRWLSDTYAPPTGWTQAKRKARGRERLTIFAADQMGAQWVAQLKEAGLDHQSPEFHAIAESALRGDIALDTLPPAMQAWVQTARTLQDAESMYAANVYRAAGLVLKAETFEKNIGSYLKSISLARVNTVEKIKNAVRRALRLRVSTAFSKVKRDAWLVWDGKKLLGKFTEEADARDVYNTTIAQRKSQLIKKRAIKKGVLPEHLNRRAARNIKIEAPLSKEWRDKYEVHNPVYLLAQSIIETRHDAEIVQLFNDAAQEWGQEAPEGLSDTEAGAWAEENALVQLPGGGQYHALAGIYVPATIAKDLLDMTRVPNTAEQAYNAYLSAWKSSKTLWNPATHARNIYGNVLVFSFLARVSALNPLNAKYYRQAATSLRVKDEAFLAMLENGAIGGEYYGGEIQRFEQELKGAEDSKIGQVLAGIKVTQRTLGQTYAVEDQIFKMAAYHKYLAEGMDAETAAEEVNKWFPNYERTGKITRWLRKSPIGAPFISFVDQSVRIARRGIADRPLRIMALVSMPGILNYLGAIAVGLNPDEKELIDKERGYFEPIVPWRDDKGRIQVIDLRYILPLANDIIPETRGSGLQVPWILSGPAATVAIEQFSGVQRFTGREFIREGMSPMEQVGARAKTIALAALPHPSVAYWGTKRIITSITGDRDEHVANAIVGSILGLNVRTPYIAEKHVKQVIQNMIDENDWREAEILRDVWNQRYKPARLADLKMKALAQGLRQTKMSKWRKVRDEAAEAILQDRKDDAQEIIDDYMNELEPGFRPLFMSGVEYRARQFKMEGKTR